MYKRVGGFITLIMLILSLIWYLAHSTLHYNIISINSFNEAFNLINHCNDKTLITFDVDDTLITTHDPLLVTLNYPLLFKIQTIISYPKLLFRSHFELVASAIFSQAHFFPTEKSIISKIQQLQNNNCKIIGLTSIETGSFGIIPSFEKWRAQMLHDFGIHFNNTFNTDIILDNLPQYRGNYPCFFEGIICTNQQPKGPSLQALLEKIAFNPDAIISFDDDLDALKSIAHTCSTLNIPFTGYHYYGAKNSKPAWSTDQASHELDRIMKTLSTPKKVLDKLESNTIPIMHKNITNILRV